MASRSDKQWLVLSAAAYGVASVLIVPGCALLFGQDAQAAAMLILISCFFFVVAGVIEWVVMKAWPQFWCALGCALFELGSIFALPSLASKSLFGISNVLLGAWSFRFGSMSFLTGGVISTYGLVSLNRPLENVEVQPIDLESIPPQRLPPSSPPLQSSCGFTYLESHSLLVTALVSFMHGSCFFLLGGFILDVNPDVGIVLWILGGLAFCLGSWFYFKYAKEQLYKSN